MVVDWWINLGQMQRVFWSVAIVSSVLLSILVFVSFMEDDEEAEKKGNNLGRKWGSLEPKHVLLAFTWFGWSSVLLSYITPNLQTILIVSVVAGMIGALLPWVFAPVFTAQPFDPDAVRKSIGEVLTSIPPHRNGFGKVHLNLRAVPFEMEAVTAGDELPVGVPVRVIEVIDERVLLVEAMHDQETSVFDPSEPDPSKEGSAPDGRSSL